MLSLVASLCMHEFRRHVVICFLDLFRVPLLFNIYFNLPFPSYTCTFSSDIQLVAVAFFVFLYPGFISNWDPFVVTLTLHLIRC